MECRRLYFASLHKEFRQNHCVGPAPDSGDVKDRVGSEISFVLVAFLSVLQGGGSIQCKAASTVNCQPFSFEELGFFSTAFPFSD